MSEKPTYELKGTLRKDCMTTPMTWSSVNLPELLSATTTQVDPDRFFFLRTNIARRYKIPVRHPN